MAPAHGLRTFVPEVPQGTMHHLAVSGQWPRYDASCEDGNGTSGIPSAAVRQAMSVGWLHPYCAMCHQGRGGGGGAGAFGWGKLGYNPIMAGANGPFGCVVCY